MIVSAGFDTVPPQMEILNRREVLIEIEEYKRTNQGKLDFNFLNNFDGNLPGGYRTRYSSENLNSRYESPHGSERYRTKTGYEFQEDCRNALLEAGFTESQLIEAMERLKKSLGHESQDTAEEAFVEILLPTYKILRLRGYKRYPDLIG